MDCIWLHDDVSVESSETESNSEEIQSELEARLYAIVHHNDLSQPLAPELAKHYSVHCSDDGEIVVTLKNPIDEIKSEELKKNLTCPTNLVSNNENTNQKIIIEDDDNVDDIIIVSEVNNVKKPKCNFNEPQNVNRQFRYTDVNLNTRSSEPLLNGDIQSTTLDINYFKLGPNFFKSPKNKQFTDLNVPPSYKHSDWKTIANESFISLGTKEIVTISEIVQKMTETLKKINPGVSIKKLKDFASVLYKRNVKAFKRRERTKRKKAIRNGTITGVDTTFDQLYETQDIIENNRRQDNRKDRRQKRKERQNGSISLNISPFRPVPPIVDLVSNEKKNDRKSKETSPRTSRKLLKSHLPTKWSKEMIKFYTKLSKRKMKMDLDEIIENMKKTTIAEDWRLDLKDRSPRRKPGYQLGRKCANCNERGHFIKECPKPKKMPTCSLCGQQNHFYYSCPHTICLKCGVFTSKEAYSGECNICYYSTFDYDTACEICGNVTHRSTMCTDIWRSFHTTTEGEKKVPEKLCENQRKYCCNCARRGHFSHDCPFLMYTGQQISSFVTNYSANPFEKGTAEIAISSHYSDIINSGDGDRFFQNLSNSTNAYISFDVQDMSIVFRINGTFDQCKRVKTEIESFVNTKKRKRDEPFPRRKRRRIR